jgi:hypothetical protein
MSRFITAAICVAFAGAFLTGGAEAAKKAKPKKEKVEYLRAAGSEPPAQTKKK